MRLLLLGALVFSLLAPATAGASSNAVVGFFDTGINPYNRTFRDTSPRAQQHPSTYLPSFPKDAEALHLSLDAPDYLSAVQADCERVWKKIVPGKLYWIPGTRIVGAISFQLSDMSPACDGDAPVETRILDTAGHGTMVASRGASKEYGACRDCLIVAAQWGSVLGARDEAVNGLRWLAANRHWIDAQSHSWGPIVPLWDPANAGDAAGAGLAGGDPEFNALVEMASQRNLAFWASGNGVAFRFGVLGHPTLLAPHLTPSAIAVGGHDSGFVTTWPGFAPHLVSDACSSWAAPMDDMDGSEDTIGSGTSGATPFVAGGAARILKEARAILGDPRIGVHGDAVARGPAGLVPAGPLKDGVLTLAEWRELVLKTATARPTKQFEDGPPCPADLYMPTPLKWTDMPPDYPEYTTIGYGAVDDPAVATAFAVLRGAPLPDRTRTDEHFAQDAALRAALHEQFTGGRVEPAPPEVPEEPWTPGGGGATGAGAGGAAGPSAPSAATRLPRPARVALRRLARVVGARGCVKRSGLRLRLLGAPRTAVAYVGGRAFRSRGSTVRVSAVPRGRFVVQLVVIDAKGRPLTARQTFRRCR